MTRLRTLIFPPAPNTRASLGLLILRLVAGGSMMTHAEILAEVSQYQPRYITVTGGEPLAQKGCTTLLTQLCDQGYQVSLETSGALPVNDVDPRVIKLCR